MEKVTLVDSAEHVQNCLIFPHLFSRRHLFCPRMLREFRANVDGGLNLCRFIDEYNFLTGGEDERIKRWDIRRIQRDSEPIQTFVGHQGCV